MADYIVGVVLVALVVLAIRSYFGKKYTDGCSGCNGCPRAKVCKSSGERKY